MQDYFREMQQMLLQGFSTQNEEQKAERVEEQARVLQEQKAERVKEQARFFAISESPKRGECN